jgi:hypothetical protein
MDIALDPSISLSFVWGSRPDKFLRVELIYRDLTEWAKHGVLLLNTSLTVRAHEVRSSSLLPPLHLLQTYIIHPQTHLHPHVEPIGS